MENAYNFHAIKEEKFLYFYLYPDVNVNAGVINVSTTVLFVLGSSKIEARVGSDRNISCLPACY